MASSVIGALRVNLGLNSAAFSKGIKSANGSMRGLSVTAKRMGAAVAAGLAAASAGMAAAVLSTSKYADEMGKAAQAVGLSVEGLSELRHAADMSGASFGDLQTGLRKLSQTMGDALTTPTSEGARALANLGISVRDADGRLKKTEQVIGDVAAAFANMEDGAQKTDAAMAIFGRSGTALIPMLNSGRDGLIEMSREAQKLGLVISEKTFRAAEAFNDNLSRMRKSFQGVKLTLSAGVLPAMENLSAQIVKGITDTGLLESVTQGLQRAMNALASGISIVFNNLDTLFSLFKIFVAAKIVTYFTAVVGSMLAFARAIRTTGLVMVAFNAISKLSVMKIALIAGALALATGNFEELEAKISEFASKVGKMLPESLSETGASFFEGLTIDTKEAASTLETYLRVQKDVNSGFKSTSKLAGDLASSSVLSKAVKDSIDPWKGFRKEVKGTSEQIENTLGNTLGNAFSGWIDSAIEGTFKFKDAIKDLAKTILRQLANSAIQNLMGSIFGGTGGGLPGGMPSFAGGGQTYSGPRTGGMDGKGGFMAMLHPNETVIDHTRSGMGGGTYVTVGVDVDNSGNLKPFVSSVSRETVANAAPSIVGASESKAGQNLANGTYDKSMTRYGSKPQPRRAG